MLRREFANHEKRCTCIISIKNFKDFRRDLWMRAVIKGEGNSWTRRVWSWRGIERLQVDAPTTELCVSENAPGMNTSIIFGKDSGIWTHSCRSSRINYRAKKEYRRSVNSSGRLSMSVLSVKTVSRPRQVVLFSDLIQTYTSCGRTELRRLNHPRLPRMTTPALNSIKADSSGTTLMAPRISPPVN